MYVDGFQGDVTWGELSWLAAVCCYACVALLLVVGGVSPWRAVWAPGRRILAWAGMALVLLGVPFGAGRVLVAWRQIDRWGRLTQ